MVLETIAGKEEVLARAVENLEKNKGIKMTYSEMDELYEIVADYIKEHLRFEPTCTVRFPNLGEAYYMQEECNKQKNAAKSRTDNNAKYVHELWKERSEKIEDFYQNNQTKKNRKKNFKIYHVIKPMWKKNRTYGYHIPDIEEIQNAIE